LKDLNAFFRRRGLDAAATFSYILMRVTDMNKKLNGPAKKLVPIHYPPFADNKSLVFRHFSRYLCRPMLKLQKELSFLIDSRKR